MNKYSKQVDIALKIIDLNMHYYTPNIMGRVKSLMRKNVYIENSKHDDVSIENEDNV